LNKQKQLARSLQRTFPSNSESPLRVNFRAQVCSCHYVTAEDKLLVRVADNIGDAELLFCIPSFQKYQMLLPPLCPGADITVWQACCALTQDTTQSSDRHPLISLLFDNSTGVCLHNISDVDEIRQNSDHSKTSFGFLADLSESGEPGCTTQVHCSITGLVCFKFFCVAAMSALDSQSQSDPATELNAELVFTIDDGTAEINVVSRSSSAILNILKLKSFEIGYIKTLCKESPISLTPGNPDPSGLWDSPVIQNILKHQPHKMRSKVAYLKPFDHECASQCASESSNLGAIKFEVVRIEDAVIHEQAYCLLQYLEESLIHLKETE